MSPILTCSRVSGFTQNSSTVANEIEEYSKLCAGGCLTPLYSLIRGWMYAEYDKDLGAKPWRNMDEKSLSDGRVPNLGLAGPFQTSSG